MALIYGFKTPRDLLEKLKREHRRIEQKMEPDALFNFVVTAYHILEWIKNNSSIAEQIRERADEMFNDLYVAVCRDLANANKHFELRDSYKGVTAKTSVIAAGYGVGRYGAGSYGEGEESVIVVLNDGTRLDALALAKGAVSAWEAFFVVNGL